MPDRRQRRRPLDAFQYKLIARTVGYWLVFQFAVWHLLFAWRYWSEGSGSLIDAYGVFCRQAYPMLLCFLLLVPIFAIDVIKFHMRIVGPILRMRRAIQDIAAERPVEPIRFRADDELESMQQDFNAMIIALAQRGGIVTASPEPVVASVGNLVQKDLVDLGSETPREARDAERIRRAVDEGQPGSLRELADSSGRLKPWLN